MNIASGRTPSGSKPKLKPHEYATKGTALQKHVSFWDRNKDGIIYPWESHAGFRALGFNFLISITSALAFHILHVSYPTSPYWIPDPRFPVYLENIHWAKHGSDTESFDEEGNFNRGKFEHIFEKYDRDQKQGLYFSEIVDMWRGNRNVFDFVGWAFQVFLWSYLWMLAADEAGVLHKSDVRRQYDGSLYYEIERRRKMGERLPWWRGGAVFGIL
ncbi:hypothetical protein H2201_000440 [Coniosporium apollinis]|uniref:Caleosin-domain-containing protein n=2 Tax=Coniosporium TaxID=2810619 RepID=A0ABQ9P666_9PEZI|nr:hypothetical protein H2199_003625 [Cladosporium sp. JES 115]KAJ9669573.1 hypothetical protein H2201_000440 [Coniosporium apollinis]